jgi:hypothetical protein
MIRQRVGAKLYRLDSKNIKKMDSPNLVDGFSSLITPSIIPSTSYPGCGFGKMYLPFPKDEPKPPQ